MSDPRTSTAPRVPTIAEAAAHLRQMVGAMYEGRSVRTPDEFKADLAALHVACAVLDRVEAEGGKS